MQGFSSPRFEGQSNLKIFSEGHTSDARKVAPRVTNLFVVHSSSRWPCSQAKGWGSWESEMGIGFVQKGACCGGISATYTVGWFNLKIHSIRIGTWWQNLSRRRHRDAALQNYVDVLFCLSKRHSGVSHSAATLHQLFSRWSCKSLRMQELAEMGIKECRCKWRKCTFFRECRPSTIEKLISFGLASMATFLQYRLYYFVLATNLFRAPDSNDFREKFWTSI